MKKLLTLAAAVLASFSLWAADPVVLINQSTGVVNGTDFRCTSTSSSKAYTVDETEFAKYIQLGGAHTTPVGAYQNNKIIQYDAKTNEVEVTVWAYNKATSDYKFYISMIEEGTTEPIIKEFTAAKSTGTKAAWTFTPNNNATIYIHVGNNSNVFICQAQIDDKGTALLKGGEIGYSVRLDSCRAGCEKKLFTLDGIEYNATSNNVKIWTPANLVKLKATTEYIKFTLAQKENVNVNVNSGTYSVTRGEYNVDSTYTGTNKIALVAGTWYIRPNGSNVEFKSLSFEAYVESSVATLASVSVGANALDMSQFVDNAGVLEYDYELSMGTTDVPAVTYTTTDANATVVKVDAADVNGTTTLTVTAEDGVTEQVYKINFSVKSALGTDATLSSIKLNGAEIDGFASSNVNYNVVLGVYEALPEVTYTLSDPNASAVYTEATVVPGNATIVVTAEDNTQPTVTYTISFTRAAATALVEISDDTTWDWTKAGTKQNDAYSASTLPTNAQEFNFADVLTDPDASFNAAALVGFGQWANRIESSNQYAQIDSLKFRTAVAGKVKISYSNTGKNRPYRYVRVNGNLSAEGSATGDKKDSEEFSVSAGDVVIDGYITDANSPQAREGDVVGNAMIRIYKLVFTKDDGGATAIDNTDAAVKATKVLRDGQVLILRDGKFFNALGVEVK